MRRRKIINENQLALPFGQIGVKSISLQNRAILFWFMAAISFISFILYIYAVNTTARHIADRQNLEKQIAGISAELNTLEFAYIELKNEITLETARQHGFQEAKSPLYISRHNSSSLSFNTVER